MTVTGVVIDKSTGRPVPYATVSLRNQGATLTTMASRETGGFSLTTSAAADNVYITSVGYKSNAFAIPPRNDSFYALEQDVKEEGEVIVKSGKKPGNSLWLALLAILAIKSNQ